MISQIQDLFLLTLLGDYLDSSQCEWSEWYKGFCDVTCGRGKRLMTRVLVPKPGINGVCLDNTQQEIVDCTVTPCPGTYFKQLNRF